MATRRLAVAIGVVLSHGLLVWGWRTLTATADTARSPAQRVQAPLVVRLWSVVPAAPQEVSTVPGLPLPRTDKRRSDMRRSDPGSRPSADASPALQVPAAAALPAPAPGFTAPAVAQASGDTAAGAPAPPASAPLRLELPRSGPRLRAPPADRHPALDDARARSPAPSIESRIARATVADWTEEALGDGRVRYRRGDRCVISTPSRDGSLDPFNQAAAPKARGGGPC